MFNPKILKKLKNPKSVVRESEMEDEGEEMEYSAPLKIGKKAMHHAMAAMAPEGKMEKEKMAMRESEKSMMPQSKIEIELMLNGAKKKKK